MAEVVNLRQARKRKQRAEKDRQAEANRIAHGRTKDEKALTRARNDKVARDHAAGRIEHPQDETAGDSTGPRIRR